MSEKPLSSKELEMKLLSQEREFRNKNIVFVTITWILITIFLNLLILIVMPFSYRVWFFGVSSVFYSIATVSVAFFFILFVIKFAVGSTGGFSDIILTTVKQTMDVEFNERRRMWDVSIGMIGPLIVAGIAFLVYRLTGL